MFDILFWEVVREVCIYVKLHQAVHEALCILWYVPQYEKLKKKTVYIKTEQMMHYWYVFYKKNGAEFYTQRKALASKCGQMSGCLYF